MGSLELYAAVYDTTTHSADTGTRAGALLTTGSIPITWNSAGWNSKVWEP